MKNYQPVAARSAPTPLPLKDSIRDMIRVQADYHLPDELFWEIFNARVLLNEKVDMNAFLNSHPYRA